MRKNIYSVGQVNSYIKNMFSQDFMLQSISIKGEVSNCKYHSSGHIYFTVKDEKGSMNAVMFAGNRTGLKFRMKEGDKIVATGSVEVYERDGKYQLYAKEIELDGEGDLYRKFELLKKELEEMGMFAPEYKKQIPRYTKKVGIVTAPTGAAVQDIRNITMRRNPYVQLILYPALVQGDGAIQSIVNGIHKLDSMNLDVLIVGRGGGSIEDLWAFNEEAVVRAVFECNTPVISAVGHETDTTLTDYAADLRAPTPSAAAELAVCDVEAVLQNMEALRIKLLNTMKQKIDISRSRCRESEARVKSFRPESILNARKMRLSELENRMSGRWETIFQRKRHELELLAGNLEVLSPLNKLKTGYGYVSNDAGKTLSSINDVKKNDHITVRMKDGTIHAEVTGLEELKEINNE